MQTAELHNNKEPQDYYRQIGNEEVLQILQ
jgi:hypothetical protein